jgi:hypothetical protein
MNYVTALMTSRNTEGMWPFDQQLLEVAIEDLDQTLGTVLISL